MGYAESHITSRLFEAAGVEGAEARAGRQLFPFFVSAGEYRDQGYPVDGSRVDVVVSSVSSGDRAGAYKVQEITTAGENEPARSFEITEAQAAGVPRGHDEVHDRYAGHVALVTWIEQLTGRSGLNIVVG